MYDDIRKYVHVYVRKYDDVINKCSKCDLTRTDEVKPLFLVFMSNKNRRCV